MTQQFSDAGQQGEAAILDKLLDPKVVFFNEGGDQASKADTLSGAAPPPKGIGIKMTVTDWNCQLHGNVAVASFIDDQIEDFHGQTMHAQYRSVETWMKQDPDWVMIGSETIALLDDPRAIELPAETLDEYVGTYQAGADAVFKFARTGTTLVASINGGPQTPQKAEFADVFFTRGRSRALKIFQRDAHGRVTAFLSRREGHDILFKRT